MDDGSGSALLLDMAQSFKDHPEKVRRSILFVFVTAKKGIAGVEVFRAHPTVDAKQSLRTSMSTCFCPIVPSRFLRVAGFD